MLSKTDSEIATIDHMKDRQKYKDTDIQMDRHDR